MLLHRALAIFLIAAAGVAWAHEGVQNKAVMERMEGMKSMGQATKVLVQMARGNTAFDEAAAEEARATLIAEARRAPALFEAPEDDPKSEARDTIWSNFDDFNAKAQAMEVAVATADFTSVEALRTSVRAINQTCGACHEAYRE